MTSCPFECLNPTTATIIVLLNCQLEIDLIFPLLNITRLPIQYQEKSRVQIFEKSDLPHPGKPGIIISATYRGVTHGIRLSKSKKNFKNSIGITISSQTKYVNLKLSPSSLHICGIQSNSMLVDVIDGIIKHLQLIKTYNDRIWFPSNFGLTESQIDRTFDYILSEATGSEVYFIDESEELTSRDLLFVQPLAIETQIDSSSKRIKSYFLTKLGVGVGMERGIKGGMGTGIGREVGTEICLRPLFLRNFQPMVENCKSWVVEFRQNPEYSASNIQPLYQILFLDFLQAQIDSNIISIGSLSPSDQLLLEFRRTYPTEFQMLRQQFLNCYAEIDNFDPTKHVGYQIPLFQVKKITYVEYLEEGILKSCRTEIRFKPDELPGKIVSCQEYYEVSVVVGLQKIVKCSSLQIPSLYSEKFRSVSDIDPIIACYLTEQLPDFCRLDHLNLQFQFLKCPKTLILDLESQPMTFQDLKVRRISSSMVNYKFELGFNLDRWILSKEINGFNGFVSKFDHRIEHSAKVYLPYIIPPDLENNISKKEGKPKKISFLVQESGAVTLSGPHDKINQEAYILFNQTVNFLRNKIEISRTRTKKKKLNVRPLDSLIDQYIRSSIRPELLFLPAHLWTSSSDFSGLEIPEIEEMREEEENFEHEDEDHGSTGITDSSSVGSE